MIAPRIQSWRLTAVLTMTATLLLAACGSPAPAPTPPPPTPTAAAASAARPPGCVAGRPSTEPIRAVGTPYPDGIYRCFSHAPAMQIDVRKAYSAVFKMEKGGEFTVQLLPEAAPGYVNNFVFLAKLGYYNGLTFHRVIPTFVAQGGDPFNEVNGPGYMLAQERNAIPFEPGIISMASSPAGVSGSQFFITLAPQRGLEANFAAFGRVTKGMDAVLAITPRDPARGGNLPPGDKIKTIEIIEAP